MALRGIERYFNKTGLGRLKQLVLDSGVSAGGTPVYPPLHIRATKVPSGTPVEGDLYFDDTAHSLKLYTGSGWVTVTTS